MKCIYNLDEIGDKPEIHKHRSDIMTKVKFGLQSIRQHSKSYLDYSYLWMLDKQQYLSEVKKYGRPLTLSEREAELEAEGSSGVKPLKDEHPPLSVYKDQVRTHSFCKFSKYNFVKVS